MRISRALEVDRDRAPRAAKAPIGSATISSTRLIRPVGPRIGSARATAGASCLHRRARIARRRPDPPGDHSSCDHVDVATTVRRPRIPATTRSGRRAARRSRPAASRSRSRAATSLRLAFARRLAQASRGASSGPPPASTRRLPTRLARMRSARSAASVDRLRLQDGDAAGAQALELQGDTAEQADGQDDRGDQHLDQGESRTADGRARRRPAHVRCRSARRPDELRSETRGPPGLADDHRPRGCGCPRSSQNVKVAVTPHLAEGAEGQGGAVGVDARRGPRAA